MIFCAFAITLGLLAVSAWSLSTSTRPPVLSLVSIEPAGILEDTEAEMWLVTFSISNSQNRGAIYIREHGVPVQANVTTNWIAMEAATANCGRSSLQNRFAQILTPLQNHGLDSHVIAKATLDKRFLCAFDNNSEHNVDLVVGFRG